MNCGGFWPGFSFVIGTLLAGRPSAGWLVAAVVVGRLAAGWSMSCASAWTAWTLMTKAGCSLPSVVWCWLEKLALRRMARLLLL